MGLVRAGDELTFDVLVVGAGVAGLVAVLTLVDEAPHLRVAVLDKGEIGSSGSTPLAQGGMAAAVGADDAPALHAADTLRAGDGLGDSRAVEILATEAPARVADLERWGARFDRTPDGACSLAREGGQTVSRSVRAADATGAEIFRALRERATGRITRLQGVAVEPALDLRSPERKLCGVWALLDATEATATGPAQEGGLALVRANAVLLATGGCGGLYAGTTNRDGATADGVALAWQAGAELADLEFVQFHPTGLKPRGGGEAFWRLLLTEALRGAGARLIDRDGRRFMPDRHPDAELAPRHVVAKAILDQPGGAWLDGTALGADVWAHEFPTVLAGARRFGFDPLHEPLPVEPCEHYMIGGAATDLHGRTTVPGLWAAGEVACAGVHGANRMAGNSLSQSCVFGRRAALDIAARATTHEAGRDAARAQPEPPRLDAGQTTETAADDTTGLAAARADLRRTMSRGAGAVRSGAGLHDAAADLDKLTASTPPIPAPRRDAIELRNGLLVGGLIVRAASLREESRGVHWREDFPGHDARWDGVRIRMRRSAEDGSPVIRPARAG